MIRANVDLDVQSARPTKFMEAIERLREEHELLRERIFYMKRMCESIRKLNNPEEAQYRIRELQSDIERLMQQLERHARWEEEELFPMLTCYFNKVTEPSILPSFWVMEKDHELAEMFVQSFCSSVEQSVRLGEKVHVPEAVSHLIQACMILSEHLNLEEEVVFPMADQILTDIDCLFS